MALMPTPARALFQICFAYMILSDTVSEESTNETFSPRWTGVNRGLWWFPLMLVASIWSTWTLSLGQPTDSETTFSELELFGVIMVTLYSDFQVSHSGQPQISSIAMATCNFLWILWFFFSILEHSSFEQGMHFFSHMYSTSGIYIYCFYLRFSLAPSKKFLHTCSVLIHIEAVMANKYLKCPKPWRLQLWTQKCYHHFPKKLKQKKHVKQQTKYPA